MNKNSNQKGSHQRSCRLQVVIDARFAGGGELGGVEQFVIGLASGLAGLSDAEEQYSFLTYEGLDEWLRPYIGGSCVILNGSGATRHPRYLSGLAQSRLLRSAARKILRPLMRREQFASRLPMPRSDGLIEQMGVDLIHFPMQSAFLTSVPSIYHHGTYNTCTCHSISPTNKFVNAKPNTGPSALRPAWFQSLQPGKNEI